MSSNSEPILKSKIESDGSENSEDDENFEIESTNEMEFMNTMNMLKEFFYDDEKGRNIVHVGIEIKRSIEKQNILLKNLIDVIKNK